MFRVFQYFIYLVRGNLDGYDPAQDMLVRPNAYLTWRRFDQDVATRSKPYAGVTKDREDAEWMIWRFNPQFYFEGVGDWLEHLAHGQSLGTWEASEFCGLFRPTPPYFEISMDEWCQRKLPLAEKFFRQYFNGGNARFDSGAGPAYERRWKHVCSWMLPCLVDERGQLLESPPTTTS